MIGLSGEADDGSYLSHGNKADTVNDEEMLESVLTQVA